MLKCQREKFSLPSELHYLNCAYMSPLLNNVVEAGARGIRRKSNPTQIKAEHFFNECDAIRKLFAELINASDPHRVAIIPAASYGIATVARNTPIGSSNNVVVTHEQFPSNVYAWRRLCADNGAELRTVVPAAGSDFTAAEWNTRILDAIDKSTAVVALGNVHWTDGTKFDLGAIAERAHSCDAAFIVDGTQSVGALEFDVRKIEPDAVICAGYKWLLGPYGIGVAYLGARYDEGRPLEETWIARVGSEDFPRLVDYQDEYREGAVRYDVGGRGNLILVPMLLAALEQILSWGGSSIQEYCRKLTADVIADAKEMGYSVEDDEQRCSHIFGIRATHHVDLAALQSSLAARNVIAALRGDVLRISPHLYNNSNDIDALAAALRDAVRSR